VNRPLWIDKSEGAIVETTSEVYAGLIVKGMKVGDISGKRAAEITLPMLQKATA